MLDPSTASPPHVEDEVVLGLDNVRLDLPIAGAGSRVLAGFVDYSILALIMIVFVAGFIAVLVWLGIQSGWAFAVLFAGLFLLNWGYFAGFEIATTGRTLGKMLVGLRVVTRSGGRPGTAALLIRNLARAVDVLIGVPLMALDPMSRRLGDRFAGTLVVHQRREPETELILRRIPAGWGAREGALLESFLARLPDLEPDRARRLAARIVLWIERDDPEFLGSSAGDAVLRLKKALIGET